MVSVIITRKVDGLGRIVVPKGMREELKIKHGQKLNVSIRNKCIVLETDIEQEDGIAMTVDELGRILIPYQIRDKIGIIEKQELNIYTENNEILLQKQASS